jgi:bla regulator protein blaR1
MSTLALRAPADKRAIKKAGAYVSLVVLAATVSAAETFDVASVKRSTGTIEDPRRLNVSPTGSFTATNVTVRALLRYAYDVQDFQIAGGPAWLNDDRFNVLAKAPDWTPAARIRLMLRSLLMERFKLRVHNETREAPLYALVIARKDGALGPELRRSQADCADAPPQGQGPPDPAMRCNYVGPTPGSDLAPGRGRMAIRGITMEGLARQLAPVVRRGIIDRTGLDGYFDGDFDIAAEFGPPPPPPGVRDPLDRPSLPSLFSLFPEQLGLRLEATRGPVEVIVTDAIEKPTAN